MNIANYLNNSHIAFKQEETTFFTFRMELPDECRFRSCEAKIWKEKDGKRLCLSAELPINVHSDEFIGVSTALAAINKLKLGSSEVTTVRNPEGFILDMINGVIRYETYMEYVDSKNELSIDHRLGMLVEQIARPTIAAHSNEIMDMVNEQYNIRRRMEEQEERVRKDRIEAMRRHEEYERIRKEHEEADEEFSDDEPSFRSGTVTRTSAYRPADIPSFRSRYSTKRSTPRSFIDKFMNFVGITMDEPDEYDDYDYVESYDDIPSYYEDEEFESCVEPHIDEESESCTEPQVEEEEFEPSAEPSVKEEKKPEPKPAESPASEEDPE